jgi:hypothetical protein
VSPKEKQSKNKKKRKENGLEKTINKKKKKKKVPRKGANQRTFRKQKKEILPIGQVKSKKKKKKKKKKRMGEWSRRKLVKVCYAPSFLWGLTPFPSLLFTPFKKIKIKIK